MVEMMKPSFASYKRQILFAILTEDVALKSPAIGLQLLSSAEEMGVVGHVEQRCLNVMPHGFSSDRPPWLRGSGPARGGRWPWSVRRRVRERKIGQVRVLGLSSAMSSAERVKRRSGSRRSSTAWAKKTNSALSAVGRRPRPAVKRQNLIAAVDVREEMPACSRSRKADERLLLHHVLEEELGGVVGGDAGGQDAANAAPVVEQVAHALGEDGIDVDVAPPAERVAAAVAQEMAFALVPCASRRETADRGRGRRP